MSDITIKDALNLYDQGVKAGIITRHKKTDGPCLQGLLCQRYTDDFGNEIIKPIKSNTVVLGGAIAAIEHLTGVEATWSPATLNQVMQINPDVLVNPLETTITLFGIGTGGSGLDFGSEIAPDIKMRNLRNMIPLRTTEEITDVDAPKYFFKQPNADGVTFNWYLKEFDEAPIIKSVWKDAIDDTSQGTEITEEVYNSAREEGIQTFAQFSITLNTKDGREYFEAAGELDMARWNELGLFLGKKIEDPTNPGSYIYGGVKLFSAVSLDNRSLKIQSESTFSYLVFSLV